MWFGVIDGGVVSAELLFGEMCAFMSVLCSTSVVGSSGEARDVLFLVYFVDRIGFDVESIVFRMSTRDRTSVRADTTHGYTESYVVQRFVGIVEESRERCALTVNFDAYY